MNAHEYQGGVQVFVVLLNKVAIMVVSRTLELLVKLGARVTARPRGTRGKFLQRLLNGTLQTASCRRKRVHSKPEEGGQIDLAYSSRFMVAPAIASYKET